MLNLHAVYKRNDNGSWEATIKYHPYIQVKGAPCLDSARELLGIYAAEELQAAYKNKRCNFNINEETIL